MKARVVGIHGLFSLLRLAAAQAPNVSQPVLGLLEVALGVVPQLRQAA